MTGKLSFVVSSLIAGIYCASLFAGRAQGQDQREGPRPQSYEFPAMGVQFRIVLFSDDAEKASRACEACRARVEILEQIFSDYRNDSESYQLRNASVGQPIAVTPELSELLARSREISQATDGAFDVTVGPLTAIWREARRTHRLPSDKVLESARKRVGWEHFDVDRGLCRVTLHVSNIEFDFGGIAKGYAADECLRLLRAEGIHSALVAASGDVALGDPPPGAGEAWRVGIASRPATEAVTHYVELSQCGISTSGDQLQALEIGDQRFSHLIDPKTGWAIREAPRVTVIARSATESDAFASALHVLEAERGLEIIDEHPGLCALLYYSAMGEKAERTIVSKNFPELHSFRAEREK